MIPTNEKPFNKIQRLQSRLSQLDASSPMYPVQRKTILQDIRLAKHQTPASRRPAQVKQQRPNARPKKKAAATTLPVEKKSQLSKLLSPKNLQDTVKTVTSLRSMVKNWSQYLIQAEQVLDTLFVTTGSLKETGVLDKLIKQRGKNLTTDDFTSVLIALMNSPLGGQMFKGLGSGSSETEEAKTAETKPTETKNP